MQIIHKLDDFFFTIFPETSRGENTIIVNTLQKYYSYGAIVPTIKIENDLVYVNLDTETIVAQEIEFKKAVKLCDQGKYDDAKPILKNLISKNPSHSEYHRVLGQLYSEQGNQDEAINCLIDALRWDATNGWALLMMGNIFAKFKSDVPTAMKYYDQAILHNKADHFSLSNIGYVLLADNQLNKAEEYLNKALKLKPDYANALFSMAVLSEKRDQWQDAFEYSIKTLKSPKTSDVLHQNALQYAFDVAKRLLGLTDIDQTIKAYQSKLTYEGEKQIDILPDADINTPAKMEFAEVHQRPKHTVKYKENYPAVAHLIMHELVHLDLVLQARQQNQNLLFTSNSSHKQAFANKLKPELDVLQNKGFRDDTLNRFIDGLFTGLNSQVFNAPIDLFIEDFLYHSFPELRPFQFLSWSALMDEAIEAVTQKAVIQIAPKSFISKTKTYSLVNALQFKNLYGIDVINHLQPKPNELKQAQEMFAEYHEYCQDKQPAEEYELVQNWADDLGLAENFELVHEDTIFNKSNSIEKLLTQIETDPYGLESEHSHQDRKMEKFQKEQSNINFNQAVAMFMSNALAFFKTQSPEQIKQTAIEIAMLGTHGINTDKTDYRIAAQPDKPMSGYQLLAWYYVSWALAIPTEVNNLGLDYSKEFEMAKTMNL